MVVRLELLVEYADAVPELRVLDVFQRVECVLVRVEGLLEVLDEQVAVAERGPGGAVLRVDVGQLQVVLDGVVVLAVRRAVLRQLVQVAHVHQRRVRGRGAWLLASEIRQVLLCGQRCTCQAGAH